MQSLVSSLAQAEGFAMAGIAAVPEPGSPEDQEERRRFADWIDAGRAGEMEYLKRRDEVGRLLRSSVQVVFPWARSVIVGAANYNSEQPRSIDPATAGSGWIARYAWTGSGERPSDYHKVLRRRLDRLRDRLAAELGDFESRCFVDTGPVVERVYARYAGLGWVGKNTCLLHEKLGSWLFLGVIVTSLSLPEDQRATVAADRCGSCTRCIDACPTNALTSPRQMDASRCISYLTIEKRGVLPRGVTAGDGPPGIRLRYLPGCMPVEPACPDYSGSGARASNGSRESGARLAGGDGRGGL